MSTSVQPNMDKQTERVNQTIEAYVQSYYAYEQNHWYNLPTLADFANNNSITMATGLSPFYANYRYHPWVNWSMEAEPKNPGSNVYAYWITSVDKKCKTNLEKTRELMGQYYNKNKNDTPKYKISNPVMLNSKNLKMHHPAKKFDHKMLSPFRINKVISSMAVCLELPES
jgi:hypothetical protein